MTVAVEPMFERLDEAMQPPKFDWAPEKLWPELQPERAPELMRHTLALIAEAPGVSRIDIEYDAGTDDGPDGEPGHSGAGLAPVSLALIVLQALLVLPATELERLLAPRIAGPVPWRADADRYSSAGR